jgi:hypothetical protein
LLLAVQHPAGDGLGCHGYKLNSARIS